MTNEESLCNALSWDCEFLCKCEDNAGKVIECPVCDGGGSVNVGDGSCGACPACETSGKVKLGKDIPAMFVGAAWGIRMFLKDHGLVFEDPECYQATAKVRRRNEMKP